MDGLSRLRRFWCTNFPLPCMSLRATTGARAHAAASQPCVGGIGIASLRAIRTGTGCLSPSGVGDYLTWESGHQRRHSFRSSIELSVGPLPDPLAGIQSQMDRPRASWRRHAPRSREAIEPARNLRQGLSRRVRTWMINKHDARSLAIATAAHPKFA
jgi:hypothetical protein